MMSYLAVLLCGTYYQWKPLHLYNLTNRKQIKTLLSICSRVHSVRAKRMNDWYYTNMV